MAMNTIRPNLFQYATSELSQDAFLCWLLKWADSEMANVDPDMHGVGTSFVNLLYRGRAAPPLPAQIRLHRQMKRADVVAEIGRDDVLVIEDKVHAGEHGTQLSRYRLALEGEPQFQGRVFHFVFLKTGDQSSYASAEENKWTVVRRAELLEMLSVACRKTDNVILHDFRDQLLVQEKAMGAFRDATKAQWNGSQKDELRSLDPADLWKGFFASIQGDLKGHWGYVPNAAGGFVGFWWAFRRIDGHDLYLQLEEESLVVKMKASQGSSSERKDLQKELSQKVVARLSHVGLARPRVLRAGATMTLAKLEDYRVWANDRLDRDATLARLKSIETAFEREIGR